MKTFAFSLAGSLVIAVGTAVLTSPAFADNGINRAQSGGYASVGPDGNLKYGLNVKSVRHTNPGKYIVRFNNDLSRCASQATIAGAGKRSLLPGYIVVSPRRGLNEVQVATFLTVTLLPADFPFNLTVNCGA